MKTKRKSTVSPIAWAAAATVVLASCGGDQEQSVDTVADQEATQPGTEYVIRKNDLTLMPVKNRTKAVKLPVSGRVVPQNETQLYTEVQGKVLPGGFRFREGISFRRGDCLLTLDSKEFSLQLESQKSAFLNNLTGMMPDLKADYPANYENWLNYIKSYEIGQPLKPLPETKSDAEKYLVTANQVYNTYYTIKAQEERLKKYRIIAPYNGMVTKTHVDIGGLVSPGQLLGTVINNENYELEAGVSLEIASQLRIGDQIEFTSNELTDQWVGKVTRINNIVDPNTQNIPVFFRIAGKGIKSGMYLEGEFSSKTYEDVFVIPSEVLSRDEKVLLLKNNTILGKPIEPVEYLQDSIIIKGLADGDQLITNEFQIPVKGKRVTL
ncbi:MAG: HlyD family efflux transporter periplasmic adaptor subunit [Cytophagales bacterium]|nr:HlyD family efflux transporter periplasmic adaptor subunit [Cytophagales bacterium]